MDTAGPTREGNEERKKNKREEWQINDRTVKGRSHGDFCCDFSVISWQRKLARVNSRGFHCDYLLRFSCDS